MLNGILKNNEQEKPVFCVREYVEITTAIHNGNRFGKKSAKVIKLIRKKNIPCAEKTHLSYNKF